ncbi:MAG: hypothetical protein C4K48_11660 [Candidatus Thorarchaeota archaeon]|nr:MAG: hypothetical protein C4K48_11660 [Candidatus Thorarchaeota archaeon]
MRSKILDNIGKEEWSTTTTISKNVGVTSSTVLYHLKNMEREEAVERNMKGRGWRITPFQQIELTEYFSKRPSRR